jgi:hypothetical protein
MVRTDANNILAGIYAAMKADKSISELSQLDKDLQKENCYDDQKNGTY